MSQNMDMLRLLLLTAEDSVPNLPWAEAGFILSGPVPLTAPLPPAPQIQGVVILGEKGLERAKEIARQENLGILLLLPKEAYWAKLAECSKLGILTLPSQGDADLLKQGLFLLAATCRRLLGLAHRAESLQIQMDEIRLVNRAKLLLMERLHMSEAQAHRFIEKSAMDRCVKRRRVAEEIIRTYEN